MSAAADSSIDEVYVQLLGEGTIVYRPARAAMSSKDTGRILQPENHDEDDEDWEFKPGSVVRIEMRTLEGKVVPVAVALAKEVR
jgi:hypothetical protein